ncbi:MAG: zf-HC2 domain-containing protein [Calditrichaeota bacterium]|nr:zf-HC2 domain-containing protein [Calditrichota bacterium]
MTCEKFRNLVSLYLDKVLSESEVEMFESHRSRCEACRKFFEEMVYVNRFFGTGEEEDVPEAIVERIKQTIKSL